MIPDVLSWDNDEKLNDAFAVKSAYLSFAHNTLSDFLDNLKGEEKMAAEIRSCMNQLSSEELNHFLYIPEITNKIFRRKNMNDEHKAQFILKGLHAEIAKKNDEFDTSIYQKLWAADGSIMMQYDSVEKEYSAFCSEVVLDDVVVDFFSPFNRMIVDLSVTMPEGFDVTTYDYENSIKMLEKLSLSLENANQYVKKYINSLVAVIIMKKFEHAKELNNVSVTSSNGAYVGRILFGNVDTYSSEEIIDGFVHEATHSLLYMVDDLSQWMPNYEVSNKIGKIIKSPWTGNMLTVRTILQAVFVWYALYQFWIKHADLYDPKFVKNRLEYLKDGFRNLDIKQNENVTKLTHETIQRMCEEVLR